MVPVGDGKQFGKACHAGKKMILPCAYGPFSRVCVMDVQWSVLDASLFCGPNVSTSLDALLMSLCSRGLNPWSVSQV